MSANDRQVAGNHYNGGAIQHWDYVIQALDGRYLEGNITKYVVRHRKKNGVQDLEKALHYLDKLSEEFRRQNVSSMPARTSFPMTQFIASNGLNSAEAFIVKRLAFWYREYHLEQVRMHIKLLIQDRHDYDRYMEAVKAGRLPTIEVGGAAHGYVDQD